MSIKLEKSGDSHVINLSKDPAIRVNLKWQAATQPSSGDLLSRLFGSRSDGPQDLDLGCMYELVDGSKGVVQALGKLFGSQDRAPFILLDQDDRSGASADGETMTVFRPNQVKRVLFFAYFYEGNSDFRSLSTRVTLKTADGQEVVLELNNPSPSLKFCALAQVTNSNGRILVTKEEKYFSGHQDTDRAYGFGFSWQTGSK